MRGFVKILETIMASIILLSTVSFFFSIENAPNEWNSASLEISGQDALATLDRSWYLHDMISKNSFGDGASGMMYVLKKMFPSTVMFSVEMEGVPRPNITIGCNCSAIEKDRLRSMIYMSSDKTSISFNSRKINVIISNETGFGELLFSDVDVILCLSQKNLSEYENEIENFLDSGGSVVLISDLSKPTDDYFNRITQINWSAGIPSTACHFDDYYVTGSVSRDVGNFFISTPIRIATPESISSTERRGYFYTQGKQNDIILMKNETSGNMYVIYNSSSYQAGDYFYASGVRMYISGTSDYLSAASFIDLAVSNASYEFEYPNMAGQNSLSKNQYTALATSNGLSVLQAVPSASRNGNGRVVWMKNYETKYTDIDQLFRSVILWSSSGKFNLNKNVGSPVSIPNQYSKVTYWAAGNPSSYTISLIMWYIF